MLRKGVVRKVCRERGEFLSGLFLVPQKEQTSDKFKKCQCIYSLRAFQNGRFTSCEGNVATKQLHVQNRSERCIFQYSIVSRVKEIRSVSLARKHVRVPMPLFRLRTCSSNIYTLLRIPIAILRRINIRIIVYLDDMLLINQTVEGVKMAKDPLIYLLQHLGFVINIPKAVLSLVKIIEFLGLEINSKQMTLALPSQKVQKLIQHCKEAIINPKIVSIYNSSKFYP